MSRDRVRSSLVVLFAAFALGGCRAAPTQVLVVIDSDSPRDRALTVSATFYGEGRARPATAAAQWTFGSAFATSFPATFTLVPGAASARDGVMLLELDALLVATSAGERAERFRRTARFRFVPNVPSVLRVYLRRACAAPSSGCTTVSADQCTVALRCEERSLTCGDDGECVQPDVVLAPQTDAGNDAALDSPTLDASVRDSARDSGSDGAPDAPTLCTTSLRRDDLGAFDAGAIVTRPLSPHTRENTEVFSLVTGPSGSSLSVEAVANSTSVDATRVLWISDRECGEPRDSYAIVGPALRPVVDAMIGPGPGGILLLGANTRYFVHHRTMMDLATRGDSCPAGADCSAELRLHW